MLRIAACAGPAGSLRPVEAARGLRSPTRAIFEAIATRFDREYSVRIDNGVEIRIGDHCRAEALSSVGPHPLRRGSGSGGSRGERLVHGSDARSSIWVTAVLRAGDNFKELSPEGGTGGGQELL